MLTSIQSTNATALAELFSSLESSPKDAAFSRVLTALTSDFGEQTNSNKPVVLSALNLKATTTSQQREKGKERRELIGSVLPATSFPIPTPQSFFPDLSSTAPQSIQAQEMPSPKPGPASESLRTSGVNDAGALPPPFLAQAGAVVSVLQGPEIFALGAPSNDDANRQPAPGSNAQTATTGPALVPGDLMDVPPQPSTNDVRDFSFDGAEESGSMKALAGNVRTDLAALHTLGSSEWPAAGGARSNSSDPGVIGGKAELKQPARQLPAPVSSEQPLAPTSRDPSGVSPILPIQNPRAATSMRASERLEDCSSIQPTPTVNIDDATPKRDHSFHSYNSPAKTQALQALSTANASAMQDSSILNNGHAQAGVADRGAARMQFPATSHDSPQTVDDSVGLCDSAAGQPKSVSDSDRSIRELQDAHSTKTTAAGAASSSALDSSFSTQAIVQAQSSANDTSQVASAHRGPGSLQVDDGLGQPAQAAQVHSGHIIRDASNSQLRVEMRTQSFGGIEIRASVSGRQVQLSLAADHGDLRSFLAPEIPLLQEALKQHDLRLEHVHTHSPETGAQPDFSSGSGKQGHEFRRPSARVSDNHEPESPEELRMNGQSGATLSIRI